MQSKIKSSFEALTLKPSIKEFLNFKGFIEEIEKRCDSCVKVSEDK